jgi:hypothetical protein
LTCAFMKEKTTDRLAICWMRMSAGNFMRPYVCTDSPETKPRTQENIKETARPNKREREEKG